MTILHIHLQVGNLIQDQMLCAVNFIKPVFSSPGQSMINLHLLSNQQIWKYWLVIWLTSSYFCERKKKYRYLNPIMNNWHHISTAFSILSLMICHKPMFAFSYVFSNGGHLGWVPMSSDTMWAIVTTERPSSVVRTLTFDILINSSEATGPIWTKFWWNGP
jgi:hypothetical protein